MEGDEFLASRHRAVVTEFIEAVVEEWACDMGQVERNILGVALRSHMETELVPGLLAIHALLLKADAEMLARLPEWLDRVQTPLPGSRDFFEEMARRLDPTGYDLLEESLGSVVIFTVIPAKAGIQRPLAANAYLPATGFRVPAFAGMTETDAWRPIFLN